MADTIYALASAPGRGGVAVFRVSGPQAGVTIERLTKENIPNARTAALRTFFDTAGQALDKGLVLWFPAPNSFTGEDVAEFHPHGGRAVTQAMLATLAAVPGCRLAEPGEFTRRAFEHDKLDLTQAEAIADLVDAETEAQRKQALRQLEGDLGKLYHSWADRIVKTLAHLEAYLDFPDEPLPPELSAAHIAVLNELHTAIAAHLADGHKGERLRDGIRIAIIGAPNAGKSSLLNALAKREAAIVSPIPGTTRDVVEVPLNICGYPVLLQDTAGLRDTDDAIEAEGVRRAAARAADADLKLAVFDGTIAADTATLAQVDARTITVLTKADVAPAKDDGVSISTITGAGIDMLLGAITGFLNTHFQAGAEPSLTRARHRTSLEQVLHAIARAQTAPSPELVAEDLRMALRHIGSITGTVDVEMLLDVIFRDFCIGK